MRGARRATVVAVAALVVATVVTIAATMPPIFTFAALAGTTLLIMGGTGHSLATPPDTIPYVQQYIGMAENDYVLPSEKLVCLRRFVRGKKMSSREILALQEGVYLCTNCDRCTVVCPSGIRLKALWVSVREELLHRGYPEPLMLSSFSLLRGLQRKRYEAAAYDAPLKKTQLAAFVDSLEAEFEAGGGAGLAEWAGALSV